MADHLITGQSLVAHFQCGNLSCQKWWDQPWSPDPGLRQWNVCPHCNQAAPTNIDRGFKAALIRDMAPSASSWPPTAPFQQEQSQHGGSQ